MSPEYFSFVKKPLNASSEADGIVKTLAKWLKSEKAQVTIFKKGSPVNRVEMVSSVMDISWLDPDIVLPKQQICCNLSRETYEYLATQERCWSDCSTWTLKEMPCSTSEVAVSIGRDNTKIFVEFAIRDAVFDSQAHLALTNIFSVLKINDFVNCVQKEKGYVVSHAPSFSIKYLQSGIGGLDPIVFRLIDTSSNASRLAHVIPSSGEISDQLLGSMKLHVSFITREWKALMPIIAKANVPYEYSLWGDMNANFNDLVHSGENFSILIMSWIHPRKKLSTEWDAGGNVVLYRHNSNLFLVVNLRYNKNDVLLDKIKGVLNEK